MYTFPLFSACLFLIFRKCNGAEEAGEAADADFPAASFSPSAAAGELIQQALEDYDAKLINFTRFFGNLNLIKGRKRR